MTSQIMEQEVLRRLVPELEADGYSVYPHPKQKIIPVFLGSYHPDAIAVKNDKKLVIEIVGDSESSRKKIHVLSKLFKGVDEWELRVEYVPSTTPDSDLEIQTLEQIDKSIKEIKDLSKGHFTGAALLMAWATFEALARTLLVDRFQKPQTPGRLIKILANEGYITPNEADQLRELAQQRNKLVHGHLIVEVHSKDLSNFLEILETLTSLKDEK